MLSPDQTGELVEATCSWARSLETAFGAPEPRAPGGRAGATRRVAAAVARARQRVVLLESADDPPGWGCGLAGPLAGALADSARRGRDVRLLLGGKRPLRAERAPEWTALDDLQRAGVCLRTVPGPVQPMLLADAVVLLGSAPEASGGPDVLQVTERPAALVAHHLADMLWEIAEQL